MDYRPVILIPVYRHGKACAEVVDSIIQYNLPIILVDDGNDDETKSYLLQIKQKHPDLALVTLPENSGKGGAFKAGTVFANEAGYSHILQIDADGQHDSTRIPFFIEKAKENPEESFIIEFMIKKCNISDIQAKFIIGVNLSRLSAGHLKGYKEERKQLQNTIDVYMKAVTDDGTIIKNEIVQELKELKAKYNNPRLCNIISAENEDNIPAGAFKIVITERNYIRKIPDVDKVGIVRKDNPKFIIAVDNRDNILIFDNKGKVFKLPVSKIPISDRTSAGTDVRILIRNLTADIAAVYDEEIIRKISKSKNKHYLTILTQSNTIKKLDLEDFLNVSPSGLMYSKIKPGDEVVGLLIAPHNLDIAICSGKKALRTPLKDIPLFKRNATGSKAMSSTNPMTGMSVFYPNVTDVIVVTRNGKFNRFPAGLLESKTRAKGGSVVIKLDKNDEILNVYGVNESDKIRVLTSEGIEEINVSDIKVKSSIAPGQKMIKSKGVIIKADITR